MASQELEPPTKELIQMTPVPVLPGILRRWLLINKPCVLTLLMFNMIVAKLIRKRYTKVKSVAHQDNSTRTFFIRCWLKLYGWINREQLVEFIDEHMLMFQKKGVIKFEFWNGLKHDVYLAHITEVECVKKIKDMLFGQVIYSYWVEFLMVGEKYGLITDDIHMIWMSKRAKYKINQENHSLQNKTLCLENDAMD